jgi:hypothetical protein
MDLSSKRALVYDSGLFQHVATKLAESFGEVLYFCEWTSMGFPTSKKRMVGVGLAENITRVYSWMNHLRDVDVVVFPDVYSFDQVNHCREMGVPTWGAGRAEALEVERWKTHLLMKEMGMPVVPAELVVGTAALRDYLNERDDLYIKCSVTRGDFETRHHVNYKLTEPWITDLEQKLGPRADDFEFIVEESVPGCEIGYDGYFVDGRYPRVGMWGVEVKDRGYVLRVCEDNELPDQIRQVNRAFAPAMQALGLRGFYSNEIRVAKDGTPYLIDPTMRAGRPPSECYMEVISNWADIVFMGAHGELINPMPEAQYAAEVILKSDWVREHYLSVDYPPKLARWIKIGNACVINDQTFVIPQDDPEFGSAIGIGDTLDEACAMALENAEKVEALGIDYQHDVCNVAKEELQKASAYGIDF